MKPRSIEAIYPLSPMQEGMLFHTLAMPLSGVYFNQFICQLEGDLDVAAFQNAWQVMVDRHTVFRTAFVCEAGEKPLQIVHKTAVVPWQVEDWRKISSATHSEKLRQFLQQDREKGLQLKKAPLMRLALFRLREDCYQFILSRHHLLIDGWALPIVFDELLQAYHALQEGKSVSLPPTRPYREYISWLQKQDSKAAEQFWRGELRGFAQPTPLGAYALKVIVDLQTAEISRTCDSVFLLRLQNCARQNRVTLNTLVQSAWAVLLSRYSGCSDVVFGAVVAGRPADFEGAEKMVGLFINALPIRAHVRPEMMIAEWWPKLNEQQLHIQEFGYAALTQIQGWSEVPRGTPLFESLFVFENYPIDNAFGWGTGSLKAKNFEAIERNNYPLTLIVGAHTQFRMHITYDCVRFDEAWAAQLLTHLEYLLAQMSEDPRQKLGDLDIVTADERKHLLFEWSGVAVDYPRDSCVHEIFADLAQTLADRMALVSNGVKYSYGELNARANRLGRYLRGLGVGPEVSVAMVMERSLEMVVGILGVLKAGGVYVPLDPQEPLERLAHMMESVGAGHILTQEKWLDRISAGWAQVLCLDSQWDEVEQQSAADLENHNEAENLAYVMFTSGSTGRPKGVSVTHRGILRLVCETDYVSLGPEERILQLAPYHFDASTFEIWGALLRGGNLILYNGIASDLEGVARVIEQEKITTLWLTATLFHQMVEYQGDKLKGLRQLVAGGDVLSPQHCRKYLELTDGGRLINGYGPTENTTFSCCHSMRSADQVESTVLIGRPIANSRAFVLDSDYRLVPAGVTGELYLAGDGLARGYYGQPEWTAEKFLPNPHMSDGLRMYRSGDLVKWCQNGRLQFIGRADHQVKVRGYRVEPGEIERIIRLHASVEECAVVARCDGSGQKYLAAYIQFKPSQTDVAIEGLREHVKQHLPEYMIPAAFVVLERLPMTATEKIDRKALPDPSQIPSTRPGSNAQPRTLEEEVLCEIWADVLEVSAVGVDDNFFNLGGDSIRSIKVIARARECGLQFSIEDLFDAQTVGKLLRRGASFESGPVAKRTSPFELISVEDRAKFPDGVEDAYPLASLQTGMLFHNDYSSESALYHDIFSYEITMPWDAHLMQKLLAELFARHPILRTSFDLNHFTNPLQLVHSSVRLPFAFESIVSRTSEEQERIISEWIETEKRRGFAWDQAPLFRVQVYVTGESRFQFLLSFHHAILDGWSFATLTTSLFGGYLAAVKGKQPPKAHPLVSSFRDFVWLEREVIHSQPTQQFWRDTLAKGGFTPLVRSRERERKNDLCPLRTARPSIPDEWAAELKNVTRRAGLPLKSVLLAVHLKVMSLLTGQKRVVTGLVSNGRPEWEDGDDVLGLFLNTVPFSFAVESGTWEDLARKTFFVEREILPHRRFPLPEIQAMTGGGNLFDSIFNFTHFHIYKQLGEVPVSGGQAYGPTNFLLTVDFALDISSKKLSLVLNGQARALSQNRLDSIGSYYLEALRRFIFENEQPHHSRSLLPTEELDRILFQNNKRQTSYPSDRGIVELFQEQVSLRPDAVALEFGDARLTYRELDAQSHVLTNQLRARGVGRESRVAICADRSLQMTVGLLAILKAGAIYVPLHSGLPRERCEFILKETGSQVLLTQRQFFSKTDGIPIIRVDLDQPIDAARFEGGIVEKGTTSGNDLAYIIYTSGSTGLPKGTGVTHRAVTRLVRETNYVTLGPAEIIAQISDHAFDAFTFEVWGALLNGGKLTGIEKEIALSPADFAEEIRTRGVTTLFLTTALFNELVRVEPAVFAGLKQVLFGGEAVDPMRVTAVLQHGPPGRLLHVYGPTENTTFSTWNLVETVEGQDVPIGWPISNSEVYILGHDLLPMPEESVGEIYVGGDGLARGYWNHPALTAEKFVPHPFCSNPGQRLYRTGDLGKCSSDGRVQFVGRLDHQVKIRGFRVELGEIESVLKQHPRVASTVVVVGGDRSNQKRLIAYVQPEGEPGRLAGELVEFAKQKLPDYMVPNQIVVLEKLPLNANGKVNYRELPAPSVPSESLAEAMPPRNPIEEQLVRLWKEILKIDRVGIHDSFAALGGQSLLATQLISRIRNEFQVKVPIRLLFDGGTVAGIADAITGSKAAAERLRSQLDTMSEAEVQALIKRKQEQKQLQPRIL